MYINLQTIISHPILSLLQSRLKNDYRQLVQESSRGKNYARCLSFTHHSSERLHLFSWFVSSTDLRTLFFFLMSQDEHFPLYPLPSPSPIPTSPSRSEGPSHLSSSEPVQSFPTPYGPYFSQAKAEFMSGGHTLRRQARPTITHLETDLWSCARAPTT